MLTAPVSPKNPLAPVFHPECDALVIEAQREFGAFVTAVMSLYGPELARRAGNHWLDVLESSETMPMPVSLPYRSVTVQAASRLARTVPALLVAVVDDAKGA
jgi:hypothetical protein